MKVESLEVEFRGFHLGPITFDLEGGELLSLIGTNGSGKTTLIRSLLGLLQPEAGSVSLYESPISRSQPVVIGQVGYVSDSPKDVLAEFTAAEYWQYCQLAYEHARSEKIPEAFERAVYYSELLDFPFENKNPLSVLSLGTTRKAQIIAALLADPSLVILDECFIGLDFIASHELEALLARLRDEGKAILASSHDLDLAARLADKVLVLHKGVPVLNSTITDVGGSSHLEDAVRVSLAAARVA